MPLLLAVIIAASLFWVSLLESKQTNPTDLANMPTYVAQDVAEDLLFDFNIANQYAQDNLSCNGLIESNELSNYYKQLYKDKKKYNLAEFKAYAFSHTESQANSRYLLVTWNSINRKAMALETVESNTIGIMVQILGQNPMNLYPVMVGTNTKLDCNIKFYTMVKESTIEERYKKAFNDLCNVESTSKDWTYVILKQIQ